MLCIARTPSISPGMATVSAVIDRAGRAPERRADARRVARLGGYALRGAAYGAFAATALAGALLATEYHLLGRAIDGVLGALLICALAGLVNLVLVVVGWIIGLIGRLVGRLSGRPGGLVRVRAVRRLLSSWAVATAVVAVTLTWLSDKDGPLAMFAFFRMFEIIVSTAALSGLLLGLAWARATGSPISTSRAWLPAAVALGLSVTVSLWALSPGLGRAIDFGLAAGEAGVAQLDLADPAATGEWPVIVSSYGPGNDARRPEFGASASWTTATVDASRALPDRGSLIEAYEAWYWGFDTAHLPVAGVAWYPTNAPGRLPLVLIVHGNHSAGDASHPGYAYLAEHLASRGYVAVSIDENFLNGDAMGDHLGAEQPVRAWFVLRHLDQFRAWDAMPGHPLAGRLDLGHVGLIGHSRGGEAVSIAALFESAGWPVANMPTIEADFGIAAVIALAPSSGQYRGPRPTAQPEADYLTIQGAYDGDLMGFRGLQTYHATELATPAGADRGEQLRVALYSARANHGRFNSVWLDGDGGVASWLLDRGAVLPLADQQRLAKTTVTAFLDRSLRGRTEYDAFFRDPLAGRAWLPDDLLLSHWESSGLLALAEFERTDLGVITSGFDTVSRRDPGLRDGGKQMDHAAFVAWSAPASLTLDAQAGALAGVDDTWSLVFAMSGGDGAGTSVDPIIEIATSDGQSATVRLSDVTTPRPVVANELWKLPGLGERYMTDERRATDTERFMHTYAVQLSRLGLSGIGDVAQIESVSLRFDGAGSAYLDGIGFEPPLD